jgi:hypothetical protein
MRTQGRRPRTRALIRARSTSGSTKSIGTLQPAHREFNFRRPEAAAGFRSWSCGGAGKLATALRLQLRLLARQGERLAMEDSASASRGTGRHPVCKVTRRTHVKKSGADDRINQGRERRDGSASSRGLQFHASKTISTAMKWRPSSSSVTRTCGTWQLLERKARLRLLVAKAKDGLEYNDHLEGDGPRYLPGNLPARPRGDSRQAERPALRVWSLEAVVEAQEP